MRATRFLGWMGVAALAASAWAQTSSPSLKLQLVPKNVVDKYPTELLITVEAPTRIDAQVRVTMPPGFEAVPKSFSLSGFSGKVIETATLRGTGERVLAGERPILVELTGAAPAGGGTAPVLASESLSFEFAPEIPLWFYLVVGTAGVMLGYGARYLVNLLKAVGPPPLSDSEKQALTDSGRKTKWPEWARRHYYLLDFAVTLALGFAVLVVMASGGRPPQAATLWPGALTTGFGLGLLANSELLTRIK